MSQSSCKHRTLGWSSSGGQPVELAAVLKPLSGDRALPHRWGRPNASGPKQRSLSIAIAQTSRRIVEICWKHPRSDPQLSVRCPGGSAEVISYRFIPAHLRTIAT